MNSRPTMNRCATCGAEWWCTHVCPKQTLKDGRTMEDWLNDKTMPASVRRTITEVDELAQLRHERNVLQKIAARRAAVLEVAGMHADCTLEEAKAMSDGWWPKLTKPARVGNGTFGVGVSARLVVEAAQRQHQYAEEERARTPEEAREHERNRRRLWDMMNGPVVHTDMKDDIEQAVQAERHACSIAVWMTLQDALAPDADDKGAEGWLREAEERVKARGRADSTEPKEPK